MNRLWKSILATGAIVGAVAGLITAVYSCVASSILNQGFLTPLYQTASPFIGADKAWSSLAGNGGSTDISGIIIALACDAIGSAIFGAGFAFIWSEARLPRTWGIPVGILYGLVVMGFMAVIVLPITGAGFQLDYQGWSYLIEHIIFGGILGVWAVLGTERVALFRPTQYAGART